MVRLKDRDCLIEQKGKIHLYVVYERYSLNTKPQRVEKEEQKNYTVQTLIIKTLTSLCSY